MRWALGGGRLRETPPSGKGRLERDPQCALGKESEMRIAGCFHVRGPMVTEGPGGILGSEANPKKEPWARAGVWVEHVCYGSFL